MHNDVYHVRYYHDVRIAEVRSKRQSRVARVATSAGSVPTVADDEG